MTPSCIVKPTNTRDVATIVRVLAACNEGSKDTCKFAVRGGGHTPFAGSANIADGVTIDMQWINQVTVNADGTVASVGAGARWGDVYSKLTPMNLAVSGGRIDNVGVAGLITGGMSLVLQKVPSTIV